MIPSLPRATGSAQSDVTWTFGVEIGLLKVLQTTPLSLPCCCSPNATAWDVELCILRMLLLILEPFSPKPLLT
ncbi:hypothetical protein GW7_17232 [Heterocephalus glaber]|uniref:Uncharacterized protein n=1 Tax=Heterocephalus glaber TaxID=10181 RepID=G5BTC5_HETGA|nr:hypothetical protein GW7_17232 [Heterocephalus glaber]